MGTKNRGEDRALRQVMKKQAEKAERMQLSEGFVEHLMQEIDEKPLQKRFVSGMSRLRKMAAAVVLVVIGSMAYAAYVMHVNDERKEKRAVELVPETNHLVRFEGLRLDSILQVVAVHYKRSVCFRNGAVDSLRFSTVWDCTQELEVFIETLNEFEGLRLVDSHDTIFVDAVKKEDVQ